MRSQTVIINIGLATLLLVAACGCRDATGYAKRAAEEEKHGDLKGALNDFDMAIELKPDLVEAFIGRGDVEFKTTNFLNAAIDYYRAAKLKPALVQQHYYSQFAPVNPTNPIRNQALSLLATKDYDKLDALAAKLRASKECSADGVWQLASVYDGLAPLNSAPDTAWDDRVMALGAWAAARPESITARVAWADVLVAYAWKARGGGEVNTVTTEGWRLFFQRLGQAVTILNAARSLNEQCPEYWSTLMRAALGLQVKRLQFDGIFDEAIKSEPGYETYYYRRAIYLLPRWYGREGEWESDLARQADKLGGENGDVLYAQVVWNLNQLYFVTPFPDGNLSWKRVDHGFEIIEKHFPDVLEARYERAYLASLDQNALVRADFLQRIIVEQANMPLPPPPPHPTLTRLLRLLQRY
jgi:hypothetical protein